MLRVYFPDSCPDKVLSMFYPPDAETIPGTTKFAEGAELTLTEIIAAKPLAAGDDPLLESERIAASILLPKLPHPAKPKAVTDGVANYLKRCGLWEPNALGPGRGWFNAMLRGIGACGGTSVAQNGSWNFSEANNDKTMVFADGKSGRLLVDLQSAIDVTQINTYAREGGSYPWRANQRYSVWGSITLLTVNGADPVADGWTPILGGSSGSPGVTTQLPSPDKNWAGVTGVSIHDDAGGNLGKYRYLLFEIYPVNNQEDSGWFGTKYIEIDVVQAAAPRTCNVKVSGKPMIVADIERKTTAQTGTGPITSNPFTTIPNVSSTDYADLSQGHGVTMAVVADGGWGGLIQTGIKDGGFDLGWGMGYAVENWMGAVRHWKRTGNKDLLPYVDEMTKNMELFRRGSEPAAPYFNASDGKRFGENGLFGSRIWTFSVGHIGSQAIQL